MFNNFTNNFILNLVKKKPIYPIASLGLSLLGVFLSVLGIVFLIPIVFTALLGSNTLDISSFTPFLKSLFIFSDRLNQNYSLIFLICLIASIFIFEKIVVYFNSLLNFKYSQYLIYEMKSQGLRQLSQIDLDYYTQNRTGDILFKINREVDKAALAISSIFQLIILGINILILLLVLIAISLPLSLIVFLLAGLVSIVEAAYSRNNDQQKQTLNQESQEYNRRLIDFLLGIRQVKNLATEIEEYQQINNSIKNKHQGELKSKQNYILIYLINKISIVIIVVILIISSYYLSAGEVKAFLPLILTYLTCLSKILLPITQLKNARAKFIGNQFSLEVVTKFLKETNIPKIESGNLHLNNLQSQIEFQNITFAYPNHAQIILDKIHLVIPAKKTTALIGSSGAGKSTLVSLISRFYQPIEGDISIDGQDIKEYNLSSLRRSIATIESEPFIFNNSIFYNLTYGINNITEERAIAATKITKAYDFIIRLSQGFDTIIGKGQTILSEAQKQLLFITRTLLLQPQIIIIDRPYENLDPREQQIIESALKQLCCDRTTILISDRLPNTKEVDKIVLFDKGKIVESGSHLELLKTSNLYQRMCSAQFKTSQQSHQHKLAKRISRKLARHNNNNLSYQIRNNLNSLLNYLQLINDGLIDDDLEQAKILDESYQSAKNMLASLREYERKISRGLKKSDRDH